jgi:RHS repeat-associated protein
MEGNASGSAIQEVIWLDTLPVGLLASGVLYHVHPDHLSTPRKVIQPSTNIAIWDWPILGNPFGELAPNQDPDGNTIPFVFNLRYPGQYFDAETGLHYNYFRDYEPGTGRYVESDPIGLRGGVSTFGYVDLNPVNFSDPLGLEGTGSWTYAPGIQRDQYESARQAKVCFDFDKFVEFIEQNRFDSAAVLASLTGYLAVGTAPKVPAELRGLGVPRDQLNPYTSQSSRWASRTGNRGLREFGRTAGGRALGGAALGLLLFEGFYDLSIEGQAALIAMSTGAECDCENR